MTPENSITLDDAFGAARKTHEIYAKDTLNVTPIQYFLDAFHDFYGKLVANIASERFAEARKYFDKFASHADELEENEQLSGVWREWEQGCRAVDHFDASEKARLTPPILSIDEMLANGTSETLIAKIYGFVLENGRPDVDAVRARKPWTPKPRQSKLSPEILAMLEAEKKQKEDEEKEQKENAEEASEKSAENKTEKPSEKTPKKTSEKSSEKAETPLLDSAPEKKTSAPTQRKSAKQIEAEVKANLVTTLDVEIESGVAPRQIAARHGIDVEEVKKRAEELKAKKAVKNEKE